MSRLRDWIRVMHASAAILYAASKFIDSATQCAESIGSHLPHIVSMFSAEGARGTDPSTLVVVDAQDALPPKPPSAIETKSALDCVARGEMK